MDYKKLNEEYYIRLDPGEEIIESLTNICTCEEIHGAHFQGIEACGKVILSTYLPTVDEFKEHVFSGMLEMASLMGNVTINKDKNISIHAHAVFSHLNEQDEIVTIAGHLRAAYINYTGEIILRPANTEITQRLDIVPKVPVWNI